MEAADPLRRPRPAAANDALRRRARRAGRARRSAPRRWPSRRTRTSTRRGSPSAARAPAGASMRRTALLALGLVAGVAVPAASASREDGALRRPHVPLQWEQRRAVSALVHSGRVVFCGGGRSNAVALTFDDGPGPYTDRLIRVLRANDAHATFFVVGNQMPYRTGVLRSLSDGRRNRESQLEPRSPSRLAAALRVARPRPSTARRARSDRLEAAPLPRPLRAAESRARPDGAANGAPPGLLERRLAGLGEGHDGGEGGSERRAAAPAGSDRSPPRHPPVDRRRRSADPAGDPSTRPSRRQHPRARGARPAARRDALRGSCVRSVVSTDVPPGAARP